MVKVKSTKSGASAKSDSIPKGRAKSGRVWKSEGQKRASARVKTNSKAGRVIAKQNREDRRSVKGLSDGLRASINGDVAAKREREAVNRQRALEATKKAEIVQVVRNSVKLKHMKKKQLKSIEKRDTTVVSKAQSKRELRSNSKVDGAGLP